MCQEKSSIYIFCAAVIINQQKQKKNRKEKIKRLQKL